MSEQAAQAQPVEAEAPKGFDVNFVREFMTRRQDRWFVAYVGLLHLAHERGLVSIEVQVLQQPSETNAQTAVCLATVILKSGDDFKRFTDIGDASPSNVSKMVAAHIIRMASTRAKGRALRDAVNIGVTMLEELAEAREDDRPAVQSAPNAPHPQQQANPPRPNATPRAPAPATTTAPVAPPQPAATPAVNGNGATSATMPGAYIALQIGEHSYQVPAAFRDLEEPQLQSFVRWVRPMWQAQTLDAIDDLGAQLGKAQVNFHPAVFAELVRVGKARKTKLQKEAAANGNRAA